LRICPALEDRGFFPPEVRAQATALACSRPREEGVSLARWSNAEIAQRLVALGIVVQIAVSTVGRWLAAEKIKPWRYHNWQHILDPQAFLERARPVLELYNHVKEKCFVDFQAFLLEEVIPEALRRGVHTVALILDNGSTHAPKQLQRWLEEQCQAQDGALSIQVFWLPTNASWLDQIEIWFSILQRELLQPNHFESLDALEKAVLAFMARRNETAKPIQWTYTVEKLEKKLGVN
jgi:transposase